MLIDLASFSILPQQATQDPLSSHPDNARGHPRLRSTLSFSRTGMASLAFGSMSFTDTEARMHHGGFFNDETVGIELANVVTRVGIANFGSFIWVEPDFAFAAVENFGGKLLLGTKIGHLPLLMDPSRLD